MEQPAERPPADGPMSDVGSLARVALPEILKRVALNELSGSFKASSGKTVRTIYFDRGFVVFTASTSNQDRFGQCLLRAGKITELELELALRLMRTRNRRIGQAIVAAGVLTEDEIGRELVAQTRRVATAIYAQTKGMYRFEQQECPIPMELRLSLSMYRLQLEGIRKITNEKLVLESLPPLDEAVRLSKCPPFSFQDVHFMPIELLVMEAAQTNRDLRTIVTRVGLGRSEVLRAIYGLLSAGILERVHPEQPEAPLKVQEETGFFLLSTLGDDDAEAQDVRQEVLLEYESSGHASVEKLLELEASASEEEIRRAFALKQVQWNKKQKELDDESTLCVKVDEIKRRLERAQAAMLGPQRTQTPLEPKKSSSKPGANKDAVHRLLREIKLRKTKNDVDGVISLLYEVVQLEPENAKYEALLAGSLASHGVMKKKAERHYRRAVSLDPQNPELRYLLGRYYQSFDMKGRAIAELKTALRIDPKFSKVRSALVELQGDDNLLEDRLEKFFS